jgi:hypothetical protein
MHQQIRTALLHERKSSTSPKERGSRFWVAAELLSTTWFIAETCVEVDGKNEIQQWVTPSINRAVDIQRALEPYQWGRLFICMRTPVGIQNATLFEVVHKAYQAGFRDSYVILLDNGMSFSTGAEAPQEIIGQPDTLRLIYAKGR